MTSILASGLFWIVLGMAGVALVALGIVEHLEDQGGSDTSVRSRRRVLSRIGIRVGAVALPMATAALAATDMSEDVRILLVTVIGGAAGWMATVLQQLDERDQDQLDLMQALRAEIDIVRHSQAQRDPSAFAARLDALVGQALQDGQPFQAFMPTPGPLVVFAAVADRVEKLPSEVVERCIRFYALAAEVRGFAEDMRSAQFLELELARRRPAYQHYFEMLVTLHVFATQAVYQINLAAGLSDPEAGLDANHLQPGANAPRVNRPAEDQSGRESARDVSVDKT
jgi:hypothetical protein